MLYIFYIIKLIKNGIEICMKSLPYAAANKDYQYLEEMHVIIIYLLGFIYSLNSTDAP